MCSARGGKEGSVFVVALGGSGGTPLPLEVLAMVRVGSSSTSEIV